MEYVIYCRKSTNEYTEKQIQSIPDQMKECMEFAEKNGYTVAKRSKDMELFETNQDLTAQTKDPSQYNRDIYRKYRSYFIVKEQKTAKEPGVRKKWNELIKLVRQGKIKGIISYHPDRQARNMEEGGSLITLVDKGMLDLKYPRFHFEATATGKMMLGFLFVFSKNYSDSISENVLRGIESNVARGKAVGKYKYGYVINDEGYHIPDDKNFKLMQEAFHMKIYEEKTNEQIGTWLRSRGFARITKNQTKSTVDRRNFSRVRADPFYYGIHIHGNAQTDLRVTNPYYQSMITEDEYSILIEKIKADVRGKAKEVRDENEEVNPIPKGLITTLDGKVFSHDFPNKNTRHMPNLMAIRKKHPLTTLADVVEPNHIRYKTNQAKDVKGKQLSVNYQDIEKIIIGILEHMAITDEKYEVYKSYMQNEYEEQQSKKAEQLRIIENQRHLLQGKLSSFIAKNLGNKRNEAEEKVYQSEFKKKQSAIDSLDRESDLLKSDERNYIAEFTAFMGVMKNMASRFVKLNYVRKREFIKIIVSNIYITNKKQIKVKLFPHIQAIMTIPNSNIKKDYPKAVSFGAGDETRTRNQQLGRLGL